MFACFNIEFNLICKIFASFCNVCTFANVKDTKYKQILQILGQFPIEFRFVVVLITTISAHAKQISFVSKRAYSC